MQPQKGGRHFFLSLFITACIFEVCYLFLVALSALPGLHLAGSPLSTTFRWTLFPSHWLLTLLGPAFFHAPWHTSALFALTLLALLGTYLTAMISTVLTGHDKRGQGTGFLGIVLGGALVFGLTLLFQPQLFSDDVFTYILSGRLLSVYGADPLNTAPSHFPHDPFLPWVISGRDMPNIYGPLWLCIASLLVKISNTGTVPLLLFKSIAFLAHLTNSILLWAILGTIAPQRQLLGTLLYAWNPLAVIELAGSGHSEGVLLSLLLLHIWLATQSQGLGYKIGSLLVLGLATNTSLIALVFAPLYLWFDVRTEQTLSRLLWGLTWRTLLVLLPLLALALPFWRGESTFFALTSAIDMDHFVHSPVGTLAGPMRALFQFVTRTAHLPALFQPIAAADTTLRASATFVFVLIYMRLFSRLRHAPDGYQTKNAHSPMGYEQQQPSFDVLFKSCALAIFSYLVLVSGWFWPWYILWMLWAVVLCRLDAFTTAMLMLSGTALFIYAFVGFTRDPITTYQSALIFGIPLVYLIVILIRQRYAERTIPSYD